MGKIEAIESLVKSAAQGGKDDNKIDTKQEAERFLKGVSAFNAATKEGEAFITREDALNALNANSVFDSKTQKKVKKSINEILGMDIAASQKELGLFASNKQLKEAGMTKEERKAYKAQAKLEAAKLVTDYIHASKSQDPKYIKKEVEAKLKENGLLNEYTEEYLSGGVNLSQWLQAEQSTVKYSRFSTAARNKVAFRAYEHDEKGELKLDASGNPVPKQYTEKEIVEGYSYTDPVSGKKIKVDGIGKKAFDEIMAHGVTEEGGTYAKFKKVGDDKYEIAGISSAVRELVGVDYNANRSKNPNDNEQAQITSMTGAGRRSRMLGLYHDQGRARHLAEWLGYDAEASIDPAKVTGATLLGAAIGATSAAGTEAMNPEYKIDATTDVKFNNVVNIDCKSSDKAQELLNALENDSSIDGITGISVAGSVIKVATKIDVFDPKIFTITRDVLGAAAKGAIIGGVEGFVLGLLDSAKNEKSVLPQLDCNKIKTLNGLQQFMDNQVRDGHVKPEHARAILMIAASQYADKNGNLDCCEFEKAYNHMRGNNILNKRELKEWNIDAKSEKQAEEEIIEICVNGYDGIEAVAPTNKTVKHETVRGILWPNLADQYDCLKDYVKDRNDRIRMMKVMQAVTNDDYTLDNLKALTAASKKISTKNKTLAQIKAQAAEAFSGFEGFDTNQYVNVLLSKIIGEQKVPPIEISETQPPCKRNADIKGTFKATAGGTGSVSGHSGDTVREAGSDAENGDATVSVTKNGKEIYRETFGSVTAKQEAEAAAKVQKKKYPNAIVCE